MLKSPNTFKWYDHLWAALILFTRLPFWRFRQPSKSAYTAAVEWWPLTGWLTAATMAATLYLGSLILPYPVAVLLALAARLLVTGALHEDGLADFFDGFGGGGTDRHRILAIMKDSHIGTYGVLGLIFYALLLIQTVASLPLAAALRMIVVGDPLAKLFAAQLTNTLPYVRPLAQSKVGAYRRMGVGDWCVLLLFGLLPLGVCFPLSAWWVIAAPAVLTAAMIAFLHRKIGGYTGDCCGAAFLLNELAFYLLATALCYGNLVG